MNGYVEAGYSVVLATLALYAGRLVLRRRTLERWLPEQQRERMREGQSDGVPPDSPVAGLSSDEPGRPGGTVAG